ncbi:STAS domain-containing protein [Streptosporangium sp. DT93]|uniref:STAS domain-containing protein n=1 Tax=Streptosporangium sp. DT93 TaxID=3393428 RepID=UPI003CEB36A1
MTTRLDLSVRRHRNASVIAVAGELDKLSCPRLQDVLAGQLDGGACHLVLDVSGLRFCDSTGLWTMLAFQRRAGASGGSLRLAGAYGVLERILTVTGLTAAFPVDLDVSASLRAVSSANGNARAGDPAGGNAAGDPAHGNAAGKGTETRDTADGDTSG